MAQQVCIEHIVQYILMTYKDSSYIKATTISCSLFFFMFWCNYHFFFFLLSQLMLIYKISVELGSALGAKNSNISRIKSSRHMTRASADRGKKS